MHTCKVTYRDVYTSLLDSIGLVNREIERKTRLVGTHKARNFEGQRISLLAYLGPILRAFLCEGPQEHLRYS